MSSKHSVSYVQQTPWWEEWRVADGVSISQHEDVRVKLTTFEGDRPGTYLEVRVVGTDYRDGDIYLDGRSRCKRILIPVEYTASVCELMLGVLEEHLEDK